MDSDVDVVLLVDDVAPYVSSDQWTREIGAERIVGTMSWGAITERRLALQPGLELDVAIGTPDWACVDPIDAGTRRVVSDGIRILHDPEGLLDAVLRQAQPGKRV